jgi:fructosamine-3-kinase
VTDHFTKHCPDHDAARAEAAGLRWLAASGTVPVPAVHHVDDHQLVMDRIATSTPTATAAERFGRELAALHDSGAPAFGAPPPGGPESAWIGRAPMRNVESPQWPDWYVTWRVEPYLRTAADAGLVTHDEIGAVEHACQRIAGVPTENPSRLHGDLWQGNVLWGADGRVWLIDPAAHGGHRETDLAMLALFGCPALDRIIAAYREVNPLADGWRDRVGLHQLFPLLVHVVLFGRSYRDRLMNACRQSP